MSTENDNCAAPPRIFVKYQGNLYIVRKNRNKSNHF